MQRITSLLVKICDFISEESRVPCVKAGLITTILSLLESEDSNVVLQALRAIGNISYENGKCTFCGSIHTQVNPEFFCLQWVIRAKRQSNFLSWKLISEKITCSTKHLWSSTSPSTVLPQKSITLSLTSVFCFPWGYEIIIFLQNHQMVKGLWARNMSVSAVAIKWYFLL